MPSFVVDELSENRKYGRHSSFDWRQIRVDLHYRTSRRQWVTGGEEVVKRRELFCWIELDRHRVGACRFFEYDVALSTEDAELCNAMDSESILESELAEVLVGSWSRFADRVSIHGSLVEFRMAWTDRGQSPPDLWAAAANHLIEREFKSHALLILKAYPLEYAGKVEDGSGLIPALEARQGAMMRHYRRLLGVRPFPGTSGGEGWLYRINPTLGSAVPLAGE